MTPSTVTLLTDGAFEIVSPFPGKRDYRVVHEGIYEACPWKVISELGESGVWRDENSFQTLDEAIDWCVAMSSETFPVPGYGINLPCGSFVTRPGKVKLEDVMASMGWLYVVSVLGHSPIQYGRGTSYATVAAYFEDLVEDTAAILGNVDLCTKPEESVEKGRELWIADITIPVCGFIHTATATETFRAVFEQEGIPHTDCFDYTTRVNVRPHEALILDFEAAFKARNGRSPRADDEAEASAEPRA